jgi:hypothetical protein
VAPGCETLHTSGVIISLSLSPLLLLENDIFLIRQKETMFLVSAASNSYLYPRTWWYDFFLEIKHCLQKRYGVWLRTGRPGFDPRQRQRIYLLATASRPALRPTQPSVQWVPGVKRGWGVMLTTHPHVVPRLRMSRSYTSSPPQAPPWCVAESLYLYRNDI